MSLTPATQSCLRACETLPIATLCRSFSTTTIHLTQRVPVIRRARPDAYAREQARLKTEALKSRQLRARADRKAKLGDPVRGIETPFVASFDNPPPVESSQPDAPAKLNFFLQSDELKRGMERSRQLMQPVERTEGQNSIEEIRSNQTAEEREQEFLEGHARAEEAIKRISELSMGSSKDRMRVNKQRCIEVLGRHETDKRRVVDGDQTAGLPQRAGPDTGSSEVQVGILTAKIRVLTQFIEGRGRMDKMNRRNLQLLVHRRQKLLRYLQKKDKGGARWQNLISTLGLTDGTWKGEISVPRYLS